MKIKGWLLILLLFLPLTALGETYTVENEGYLLSLDGETLALSLTDKASGITYLGGADPEQVSGNASWKGFLSSTLSIDYTSGTSTAAQRADVSLAETEITAAPVENGVDFSIDFSALGQKMKVEIRLLEDGLSIRVPGESMQEYGDTQICGLYLLPCFGATRLNEEAGYILVPEAAGAIISFSDGRGMGNTPYVKRIYGDNVGVDRSVSSTLNRPAEKITLPLYGMAYTDRGGAFLAVVEEGEEAAEILAYPGGVITEYNWAAAHFILRETYIRQTTRTMGLPARETNPYCRDMAVRFCILRDGEATYAGMARKYRSMLEEKNALRTADTAYRPRIDFLGAETEQFLLWDQLVPMTSARQAQDILKDALDKGLTAPLVSFRGWMKGGLSKNLGSGNVNLEGRLGGRQDMEALKTFLESSGGIFFLEADPVQANPGRAYNMRLDIVRSIGQTVAEIPTGKDLYPVMYYLTPRRTAEILAEYEKQYAFDFSGLTLATLTDTLFSYYSAGRNYTRGDTLDAYRTALDALDGMNLALKNPLAAYYPYMEAYLDMPLSCTSYSFITAEVPFLPLVLSGHVPYWGNYNNFDSNQRRQMLKLVEYGAFPSFLVTAEEVQKLVNTNSSDVFTAQWDVIGDTVLKTDAEIKALWEEIGIRRMTDHTLLSGQAALVQYGDDLFLVVNYGDTVFSYQGTEVQPLGYVILKGGDAP